MATHERARPGAEIFQLNIPNDSVELSFGRDGPRIGYLHFTIQFPTTFCSLSVSMEKKNEQR
ncbi:hypothetical protein SERLADRAFT_472135 [Serpula lacrymans var. lacrymans S7.9]|uniref:Uncharacterized protein n=1 Tax=Serpula lacrymans var. lacrymans (strain S7.9) TaxID=578457 RepID=F8P273_SERL9|nr:uncharacterized protein SERLADRAFT_472135 [Serpula lacrymans var. lacrymans S7.9]EGO23251.1 hypothetical protein SERLADRAFT_472135 [Serpula lacrymans var. lacrymans S7.9]